jgi:hypothetical protein
MRAMQAAVKPGNIVLNPAAGFLVSCLFPYHVHYIPLHTNLFHIHARHC